MVFNSNGNNRLNMKKITLLLLLTLSVLGLQAQTYQLNYDSIRVGKTAGTGGTSLYGKVYLKNVSARAVGDSILSVLNGRIFKIPVSAIVPTLGTSAISLGGTANGLSYSAGNYRLHKVTATTGGVLTTGVDTIAGNKILLDSLTINKNPAGVYSSSLRVGTGTGSSTQTGVQVSMQLNDALLTETGHGFSDATEFAVTGMSYNSYDARPSFSGSATNRDHYTGFQFGPSASSTSNFTDLSFLRIGSNLTNINAANFYGLNMPQMSGTAFTNKYVVFSADTSAIIDIGGKIKNRKGGIEIIGTSKFNTTSWPTSAVSPATGRMLVGSDAIIIWNKATPTIGNKALITLGSKFGSDTSSLSGAVLRTNLKNTTTGASELEIFTTTSSSTNERAVRFDENQNTTFDGQILDAVIPHRATAADSIQVLDNGKFAYRTPSELRSDIGAGTGNGTVTSVTSANSDIVVATGTTTPVLTLATGTGTGSLVRATSPTLVTPNIGTPTASGTITSTVTSNSFLDATTATTSRKYGLITNTGGYFVFGVEPSTGGGIVAGSAAYSTSIGTGTATDLNLSTNGAIRQKILSTGDTEFSGNISAANLTASTKVNVASPSGTTGDVNTGQAGIYSYRSAGRYVRFNTSGSFNDFLSLGAKLVMNYGFSGTVENISMFEGSAAGDGQFIVGSPTATNARFLLKGKDTGTTNYISRWFDSGNTEKFSVRNDGLATFTGALTGTSATFSSTISASNLTSGTYTPTLTNGTNVSSSTAYTCQYMRVGNVVTVSGRIDVTMTASNTATEISVSLPIVSNFSGTENLGGTGNGVGSNSPNGVKIEADTTNDRATYTFDTGGSGGARKISFSFTYLIL